jgi:serine protease DegQ
MKKLWLIFAQTTTIGFALVGLTLVAFKYWPFTKPAISASPTAPVITLPHPDIQLTFSYAAKKAMPSVVNIYTAQKTSHARAMPNSSLLPRFLRDHPARHTPSSTLGSGVIVRQDGYIVTNSHVVRDAEQIEVALSTGEIVDGIVIGADLETDLAVLKVNLTELPAIPFARTDQLQVGDAVLAIGNPFGIGQTVSMGIISALGRNGLNLSAFENFIQTDAVINPGSSGGALINLEGQLIGINSNIMSDTGSYMGIGFAIPANTVKQIMEEIIRTGAVTRGWIGIEGQNMTPDLAQAMHTTTQSGVLITRVVCGQPADKSGLRPGDLLIAVNRTPINDFQSMLSAVAALPPGTPAKVKIVRKETELTLNIVIGQRPSLSS